MKNIQTTCLFITLGFIHSVMASVSFAQKAPSITPSIVWDGYDQPWERYREIQLWPFNKFRGNKKFVDKKTIIELLSVQSKERQKIWIEEKLKFDLNNDGKIELFELEMALEEKREQLEKINLTLQKKSFAVTLRRIALFKEMMSDLNRDRAITRSELMSVAKYRADEIPRSWLLDEFNKVFALDPDQDGVLTLPEMEKIIKGTYSNFDTNGDGKISDEEKKVLKPLRGKRFYQKHFLRQVKRDCTLPPVGTNDQVVVVSAGKGHALSSVATGGFGGVTTTGTIKIKSGNKPIYLLLLSKDNLLWNLTGAVSRLSMVVVQSGSGYQGPGSGVRGVPVEKTFFKDRDICFDPFLPLHAKLEQRSRDNFFYLTGRKFDTTVSSQVLSSVMIPPAENSAPLAIPKSEKSTRENPKKKPDRLLFPGGLVRYSPQDVVSVLPPKPYEVFPGQIGLDQLLANKSIVQLEEKTYLVQKPFKHFPAGLSGSKEVKFILAKGIPVPSGSPGTSCVIRQGTNEIFNRSSKISCGAGP